MTLVLFHNTFSCPVFEYNHCFDLHEGTASGSHQAEHRKSVDDEAHLFVGQQRVDENETRGGQKQQSHPPVEEANGDKEQRGAQGTGNSRIKVPQEGRGLLGRGESRITRWWTASLVELG